MLIGRCSVFRYHSVQVQIVLVRSGAVQLHVVNCSCQLGAHHALCFAAVRRKVETPAFFCGEQGLRALGLGRLPTLVPAGPAVSSNRNTPAMVSGGSSVAT